LDERPQKQNNDQTDLGWPATARDSGQVTVVWKKGARGGEVRKNEWWEAKVILRSCMSLLGKVGDEEGHCECFASGPPSGVPLSFRLRAVTLETNQ